MKKYYNLQVAMVIAGVISFFIPFFDLTSGLPIGDIPFLSSLVSFSGFDLIGMIYNIFRFLNSPLGSLALQFGSLNSDDAGQIFAILLVIIFILSGPLSILIKSIKIVRSLINNKVYKGNFVYFYIWTIISIVICGGIGAKINQPLLFFSIVGSGFWLGLIFYISGTVIGNKIKYFRENDDIISIHKDSVFYQVVNEIKKQDTTVLANSEPKIDVKEKEVEKSKKGDHGNSFKILSSDEMAVLIAFFVEYNSYKFKPQTASNLLKLLQNSLYEDNRIKNYFTRLTFSEAYGFFKDLEPLIELTDKNTMIEAFKLIVERHNILNHD